MGSREMNFKMLFYSELRKYNFEKTACKVYWYN